MEFGKRFHFRPEDSRPDSTIQGHSEARGISREQLMRGRQIVRQWQLLRLVHISRYMTVGKLAKEFSVTTKTIRRDLTALEQAGFPLYRINHDGYGHFLRMEN